MSCLRTERAVERGRGFERQEHHKISNRRRRRVAPRPGTTNGESDLHLHMCRRMPALAETRSKLTIFFNPARVSQRVRAGQACSNIKTTNAANPWTYGVCASGGEETRTLDLFHAMNREGAQMASGGRCGRFGGSRVGWIGPKAGQQTGQTNVVRLLGKEALPADQRPVPWSARD